MKVSTISIERSRFETGGIACWKAYGNSRIKRRIIAYNAIAKPSLYRALSASKEPRKRAISSLARSKPAATDFTPAYSCNAPSERSVFDNINLALGAWR